MAMSKPYPTGQICITMRCELCNTDVDVNWFCKNCIHNLCDNCKRMHEKIPSLCSHDIGTIGEGRRFNRDANALCPDHGELLQFRCKPCLKDICDKCLKMHLKHELTDLNEEGENMRKEFRTLLESKKKEVIALSRYKTTISDQIREYNSRSVRTIAEIKSKFDEITIWKDSILKKVENNRREGIVELEKEYKAYEDAESTLQRKIEISEGKFDAHHDLSLVHFVRKETAEINAVKIPPPSILPRPLILSQKAVPDVKQIFGTLELADGVYDVAKMTGKLEITRKPQIVLTVVSCFSHNKLKYVKLINDIACTADEKAWIASAGMPLQLVDHTGKVHKNIALEPQAVHLAVSPSGDVMVSLSLCGAQPVASIIQKISPDGSVSVFTDVKSCFTVNSLACNSELDVLVFLSDTKDVFHLAKFDKRGKELWRNKIGEYSFYTSSLCMSPDGNYHLMAGTDFCVTAQDGSLIERKKFDSGLGIIGPIIYDSCGYLIVGTREGKIHVLNGNMECLQTHLIGIKCAVRALAVDTKERLWIGTDDGKVTVANYLE